MATGEPPINDGNEGLRVLKASQRSLGAKGTPLQLVSTSHADRGQPASTTQTAYFAHDTAVIDDGVLIGKGTKIWHFSHLIKGSIVGTTCNIGQNVVIGPDVTIGNACKIQNNVSVYKGVCTCGERLSEDLECLACERGYEKSGDCLKKINS